MGLEPRYFSGLELLERIGAGSLAVVFKAIDRDGDIVAVKLVPDAFRGDPHRAQRWRRETEIVTQLSHPHIVRFRRVGYEEGHPYIVMDYLPGGALEELLDRHHRLQVDRAVRILGEVGSALEYLHERDIIHRDVKADNILFAGPGPGGGKALLSDFSLAYRGDWSHFSPNAVGPLDSVAPEILRGKPASPLADQFSLAVLAFRITSGVRPFTNGSQLGELPPRLTDYGVPHGVSEAVSRAMSAEPADRFRSVSEFCAALVTAVPRADVPPPARRSPAPRPVPAVTKPVKPHRGSVGHAPIVPVKPTLTASVLLDNEGELVEHLDAKRAREVSVYLWARNEGSVGARDVEARLFLPAHPAIELQTGSQYWGIGEEDVEWLPNSDSTPLINTPLIDRLGPRKTLWLWCRVALLPDRLPGLVSSEEFTIRGSVAAHQTGYKRVARSARVLLGTTDVAAGSPSKTTSR